MAATSFQQMAHFFSCRELPQMEVARSHGTVSHRANQFFSFFCFLWPMHPRFASQCPPRWPSSPSVAWGVIRMAGDYTPEPFEERVLHEATFPCGGFCVSLHENAFNPSPPLGTEVRRKCFHTFKCMLSFGPTPRISFSYDFFLIQDPQGLGYFILIVLLSRFIYILYFFQTIHHKPPNQAFFSRRKR